MRKFEIKVIGFESVVADSEEEALEKFDQMLRNGYTVMDLRWKSVQVENGSEEDDDQ